ncbi:hypothetical protein M441DRAFT_305497 [Trichoderma asperellum CBS 433.97]|uniref:Uncharacterized protein n=1 Tax=Trichoderma asperellum (strain ATCC 204424 / CBS 433.97 / NBRC 101777) TaxID=1042311 RepID=A0A2T3ZJT8_TRIA4|nr:hypothetical protein M441DRAFT_305497 [Trichoderma asperellum CBS 433.97]PTB45074.1 hypothetical protein M441DRAFT_305497 [Trichoderma asperellum CBS 433.97]
MSKGLDTFCGYQLDLALADWPIAALSRLFFFSLPLSFLACDRPAQAHTALFFFFLLPT